MRWIPFSGLTLIALAAACDSAEAPITAPPGPSDRGMTVALSDSLTAPGASVAAEIANLTGGSIRFGMPACGPMEQLTGRGWAPVDRRGLACAAIEIVLENNHVYQFPLDAPASPGVYRWQVVAGAQDDSTLAVWTAPLVVK